MDVWFYSKSVFLSFYFYSGLAPKSSLMPKSSNKESLLAVFLVVISWSFDAELSDKFETLETVLSCLDKSYGLFYS